MGRLEREEKTFRAMIHLYCGARHRAGGSLCTDCQSLLDYAALKILRCPHQEAKPSCAKCQIHCFRQSMRDRIKLVMRDTGPSMLLWHPILTLRHFLDSLRSGRLERAARPSRARPARSV